MRNITFKALRSIIVFFLVLSFARPALAHGGEPRLEISVQRINPGGVVDVRGVEFDYDEPVALALMRSEIQITLIEVVADGEGIFTQIILLPADLPTGEYNFRAKSDHHLIMSPTITVRGVAVENQESNVNRDQSDVQFGPAPTFAPGVVPGAVLQPTAEVEQPIPERTLISSQSATLLLGLSILLVLAVFFAFRRNAVAKG